MDCKPCKDSAWYSLLRLVPLNKVLSFPQRCYDPLQVRVIPGCHLVIVTRGLRWCLLVEGEVWVARVSRRQVPRVYRAVVGSRSTVLRTYVQALHRVHRHMVVASWAEGEETSVSGFRNKGNRTEGKSLYSNSYHISKWSFLKNYVQYTSIDKWLIIFHSSPW